MKYVVIYFIMLSFDLTVLAGSVWLIGWNGWNPWWFAAAVILSFSSNPSGLIKMLRKEDDERRRFAADPSYRSRVSF